MIKFSTKIFLWFISFILVLSTYLSSYSFADNQTIIRPEASFVPDVNFFDKEGNKIFLDQFEGRTILISFWASWCGACVEELPSLDVLQKDFRKLPFEVIAISEDFKGIEAAEIYFNNHDIRHLKLYHDYKNSLFKAMSVVGMPTAFLIDPDGKVKVIFKGNIKWHDESIRNILLSEIAGNPEIPKNTYVATSLNKKITPIKQESEEKNPKKPMDDKVPSKLFTKEQVQGSQGAKKSHGTQEANVKNNIETGNQNQQQSNVTENISGQKNENNN